MTSIRRPGNTGITGGIKGINNKVPTSSAKKTEEKGKKHDHGGWKPAKNDNKPTQTPTRPPVAR
ncbi:MAG: hypothetical protein ACOZQL_43095 [Myxococcota bacterium]